MSNASQPFVEFCSALPYQELSQKNKEEIKNWVVDEKNQEKSKKLSEEVYLIITEVYKSISSSFLDGINGIYKKQIRIKLFQSLGNLSTEELQTKRHHILFTTYMENNSSFSSHIIKEVIQLYSDKAVQLFEEKPHYFQEFFKSSRSRTEGWFQHFHYDGKMEFGARAIERFTFTNRKRYGA